MEQLNRPAGNHWVDAYLVSLIELTGPLPVGWLTIELATQHRAACDRSSDLLPNHEHHERRKKLKTTPTEKKESGLERRKKENT